MIARSCDWTGAMARAQAGAPFLARATRRLPALAALLAAGESEAALALARAAGADAPDLAARLRRERLALALALAIGDLAGAFPLARVTAELSDFADRALDAAIAGAIVARVPDAQAQGFIALALGKHGARELNYSSDIDAILLYDPARLPRRADDDPARAADRVARGVVDTLSRVTDEGYVFRVDLRLRPASEVSPPALPLGAALAHYESSALAWERAAFIRARAAAGDIAAGEGFLAAIRPFVWRRSLDFGALAQIGRLTAQIRANARGPAAPGPGFDLKRGRGGIREIEFYAQVHQLIHGGRDPGLRQRGTRPALDALAAAGLIAPDEALLLGDSYDRLRTIEHRLQMVGDQQTHALPLDPAALDGVARLDGLPDGAALVAELAAITDAVGARYDSLLARHLGGSGSPASPSSSPPSPAPGAFPTEPDALAVQVAGLGLAEPEALAARIAGWRAGKLRTLRSEPARAAFEAVLPDLLAALAAAPDPARAIVRFEQLLAGLPSAINLFRLLEARPGLLELLARVLSLAPPLADALARRADLLDPLIDARAFALPGSVGELAADFARGEAGDDYEHLLDRVRRQVSEQRFLLGVQLIGGGVAGQGTQNGSGDPLAIAAALARVAEAALAVMAPATIAEFARAHGTVPGSEIAVLGLGRIGGGALTHSSDLDLVFVFTGAFTTESDGRRPLGATLYFNRLAQRIIAALSVATARGPLYEVDTRLRPSGAQGPLAVSLASFARYQREAAWTWEHMALARARPLFGSDAARAALQSVIAQVLVRPRDADGLRADVLAMRARMAAHKPAAGPLDLKLLRGGMVDIEFLTHARQLQTGVGLVPEMGAAVRALIAAGLLPPPLAAAHDLLTRTLVTARLLAPDGAVPSAPACQVLANACGCADWTGLLEAIARARGAVAAAWAGQFGETLEIG